MGAALLGLAFSGVIVALGYFVKEALVAVMGAFGTKRNVRVEVLGEDGEKSEGSFSNTS